MASNSISPDEQAARMEALKDALKIKYVFDYLWVHGFGWENTVYCQEDFERVEHLPKLDPDDHYEQFRAYDKNGTAYRLKGSVSPG